MVFGCSECDDSAHDARTVEEVACAISELVSDMTLQYPRDTLRSSGTRSVCQCSLVFVVDGM